MNPRKVKVGILGLTLEFYEAWPNIRKGRDAWVRRRVLPALQPYVDPLFHGAVYRRADIEAEVRRLEQEGAEALLVIALTYATSLSSLQALKTTPLPVVVWNTQELFAVDASYGSAELVANHGVHGTFDLGNVLVRSGVRFGYLTSHLDDPGAAEELALQLRAAAGVTHFRTLRLGVLGYPFPGMGDFGLDTTHLTATLGCAVEALPLSEYQERVKAAPKSAVAKLAAEYRRLYDMAAGVTAADLAATARAELALRGMIRDYRLDAYSYQFLAFGKDKTSETLPFVAASRLMAEGVGFGGEGDLIAASFATVLNRLAPPAGFSEIFTIDFGGNSLLLAHMGEANAALARTDRKIGLRRRGEIVPVTCRQLVLTVAYQPGPATLAALTLVAGGRWRIIASAMRFEDFGPLAQAETPQSKIAPAGDVRDWLTAYALAGGPHHLAVCFGNACAQLKLLAHLLGAEFIEV
jgi:L-arabinose isomerase